MRKNILNHFIIILTGIIAAQILATLHVYLSNKTLFHTIRAITDAGYLAVPNALIIPNLTKFFPAFCGGLFFTLSIGISLSLITFAGSWIWDCITGRNQKFLFILCIFWLWCIVSVNLNGFAPMPTFYFLVIPLPVFLLYLYAEPKNNNKTEYLDKKSRQNIIIHLIFFIILIIAGSTQANTSLFSKFRDNFLLSNYFGIKLNKFYYDYTLYAAQVFKSLEQKTLKTCSLSLQDDPTLAQRLEKILLKYDYLVISNEKISPDLVIVRENTDILFKNKNKTVLRITSDEFFRNPKKILEEFSHKTDRHVFFRQFTFFSILFSSAVSFYLIPYFFFRILFGFYFKLSGNPVNNTPVIAGILSLAICIGVIFYLSSGDKGYSDFDNLSEALTSDSCRKRVDALKFIFQRNMEIAQFPSYRKISESPCLSERYRLAKALGISRSPETYPILLNFLDDTNFNVVYNAFYSLGKRGEKDAVGEILRRIKSSDNWYVQWYAYRALKRLGWTQNKIKIKPFLISLAALFFIEAGRAILLKHISLPMLVGLGGLRFFEIIIFILIFFILDNDLSALGLASSQILPGIKKGLIWSLGFGVLVIAGAGIIYFFGINPIRLIHTNLPKHIPELIIYFLVAGIIAPIAEEIFFRGILYGFLRSMGVFAALFYKYTDLCSSPFQSRYHPDYRRNSFCRCV